MSQKNSKSNLNQEPQKPQKTSVADLRQLLHSRFEAELYYEPQGPSDVLEELVIDPIEESGSFPLFFQQIASRWNESARAGRRVPSRSEGAVPPFDAAAPPLTIRGVTNRQNSNSSIQNRPQAETPFRKILGGYDGGVTIGYNGLWSDIKFKQLLAQLETARLAAETEGGDDRFVTLGNMTFAVKAHGGQDGAYYKYIIEGGGIKVLIHANPKGNIQPIRLRYGAECLTGRDLFAVHLNTLQWLENIGFKIEKEILSRVDLQVMLLEKISEILIPILSNQCVTRAVDFKFHGTRTKEVLTGFTAGGNTQICIYNKKKELLKACDETKMSLIFNDCLGGEFPDDLTRIEFRLQRKSLKYVGINTVQDLLERETALVDYLTYDWFRILDSEKKSEHGNEHRQKLHAVWQQVRDLFFEYFPGTDKERKPIEHNSSRRVIKCTGESLVKQAIGCLATTASLVKGEFASEDEVVPFFTKILSEPANVKKVFQRTRERTIERGIVRGASAPDAIDWHLEPRYTSDAPVDSEYGLPTVPLEFREIYDEHLPFDIYNENAEAIEKCPF